MKRLLIMLVLLTVACAGQTTTNLGLSLPPHGTPNWDTYVNGNSTIIDTIFNVGTCGDGTHALAYNAVTKMFACQLVTGTTVPGGIDTQMQYNNAGTLAGTAGAFGGQGLTWDKNNASLFFESDGVQPAIALSLGSHSSFQAGIDLQNEFLGTSDAPAGQITGINAQAVTGSAHEIGVLSGLWVWGNFSNNAGHGIVDNNYGLHIEDMTGGGVNNIALHIASQTGHPGSSDYAIKIDGGQNNLGPQTTTVGNLIDSGLSASVPLCSSASKQLSSSCTAAGIVGLFSTCSGTQYLGADGACHTATSSFSSLTGGTNTTAAMLVGTGASLGTTGSGTISATALNGTAFTGTSGNFVSFGAANIPADSGVVVANAVTQTSNAASGQVCTYTGTNKVCVPATALPNGVTATTQSANDNSTKVATTAYVNAISAGAPAGPQYDYYQCDLQATGAATSNSCASSVNVTTGDQIIFACQVFNNDGGTATLSASDSLSSTVTQLITHFGTSAASRLSIWLLTATASGADTFTCTDSASKTFWSLAAIKVTGVTGTDVTASADTGSNAVTLSGLLTTTVDNDLAILWVTSSTGLGSLSMSASGGFNVIQRNNPGSFLGTKKLAKAGTYTLQGFSGGSVWSTVAVALK